MWLVTDKIAIVLLTARTRPEREDYAKATLRSLGKLHSNGCDLRLHIGDDGSGNSYKQELVRIADEELGFEHIYVSDSGHMGYGANYNLAMKSCHEWADYIMPVEDDWELTRDLDIDLLIAPLRDKVFDSIRLGYIGYTQPLYAQFIWYQDKHWLLLRDDSHEPHVFSGHPRLETIEYQKRVGPWPEGLSPGETEWAVATGLPEARKGIGYPLWLAGDVSNGVFAHIGTQKSY